MLFSIKSFVAIALLANGSLAIRSYANPACSASSIDFIISKLSRFSQANSVCVSTYNAVSWTSTRKGAFHKTVTKTNEIDKMSTVLATTKPTISTLTLKSTTTSTIATVNAADFMRKRVKRGRADNYFVAMYPFNNVKLACECFLPPVMKLETTILTKVATKTNIIGSVTKWVTNNQRATTTQSTTTTTNACRMFTTHDVDDQTYIQYLRRRGDPAYEITLPGTPNGQNGCWDLCNRSNICIAAAMDSSRVCHYYTRVDNCGIADPLYLGLGILKNYINGSW